MNKSINNVGIGLRSPHVQDLLQNRPAIPWLELLADNHLSGLSRDVLFSLREDYPMTMHGVNLSLGGLEPIDWDYADSLKTLYQELEVSHFSEHLCFTYGRGLYSHDLLPMPYTDEAVHHCAGRIAQFQDYWGERILIENVSSYVNCSDAVMTEAEFVTAVVNEAGCGLLLDINNLYVNQVNHGESARCLIDQMAPGNVGEIHLAGFEDRKDFLLDAHNQPVSSAVWALYQYALSQLGPVPSLIEWDSDIPPISQLLQEREQAQTYFDRAASVEAA